MKKYTPVSMENYCIQELECRCNDCNNQFSEFMPFNYELVCFEDEVGKKYFLPTYGDFGYLDLLNKLVEQWNYNENITKKIVEKFEKKLSEITEHKVSMVDDVRCPFCKSEKISICKRNTLEKYPVNWLKIDIESM